MKLPAYLQYSMRGIVLESIMLHLKWRGHLMSTPVIMFVPSRAKRFLSSPQSPGQL